MSEAEKDTSMDRPRRGSYPNNLYTSDEAPHGSKGEEEYSNRKAPDAQLLKKKQKVEARVTEKELHVGNDEDINGVEDDNSTIERPSRKEALKAVMTLINYFSHHEKTLPEVVTMIRKVQDEIQGSNGNDSKDSGDAAIRESSSGSKRKEPKYDLEARIEEFLDKRQTAPRPEGCVVGCCLCGQWGDHYNMFCPYLKYFPKGTEIHPWWETMCKGCDRVGTICCDKGGYAEMKFCPFCCETGHWVWEDVEGCLKPENKVFKKREFFEDYTPNPFD